MVIYLVNVSQLNQTFSPAHSVSSIYSAWGYKSDAGSKCRQICLAFGADHSLEKVSLWGAGATHNSFAIEYGTAVCIIKNPKVTFIEMY
jgi:hypothetical protein